MTRSMRQGHIITFYSYKGGVGRSMTLANVAWILASNGMRVLAVDWDLEAPGLHRYFQPFLRDAELADSPGIIDLMWEFAGGAMTSERDPEADEDGWMMQRADVLRYAASLEHDFPRPGTLDFIPAGRQRKSYAERVNTFDWQAFYDKMGGGHFLEALKESMRAEYDYVLIDSRTGVSDTSGICTVQMPDSLVVLFTANEQSIKGAKAVIDSVRDQWNYIEAGSAELRKIIPVFSRVELAEQAKLNRRRTVVRAQFKDVLGFLEEEERDKFWGDTETLYIPFYSYEEALAVLYDQPQSNTLLSAIERLTSYITDGKIQRLSVRVSKEDVPGVDYSTLPGAVRAFLSYNSVDKPAVEEIARHLRDLGIEPWLDKWNLVPGRSWQSDIEDALASSQCCCVFLGPSGFGPWQHEEMRATIGRLMEERDDYGVIPVLLPGATRPRPDQLPKFLVRTTWVEFRTTLDEENSFRRLVSRIKGEQGAAPWNAKAHWSECPYPGLDAFEADRADFFFGRESLTEWLVDAVRRKTESQSENRFLAVVGASGIGKSSVVLAGLVPALQQGSVEGSSNWPILIFRPGKSPLENLAYALVSHAQSGGDTLTVEQLVDSFARSEMGLHSAVNSLIADRTDLPFVLVVVDQFEELFTECQDVKTREHTIANLLHAASAFRGRTLVVITMRSDFYARCTELADLATTISANQELVGPMSDEEVREVIERPANRVGCEFEPGLVELLVRDFRNQDGGLPLLQHALEQLWRRCKEERERKFTTERYLDLGGVEGALNKHAEEVYHKLASSEWKGVCRGVLLQLVRYGRTIEDTTRRRARQSEFGDSPATAQVIEHLARGRLLTTSTAPNDESLVEIAHDTLIRAWDRLGGWITDNVEAIKTYNQFTEAEEEWTAHEQDPAYLLTRARLAQVEELHSKADVHGSIRFGENERSFLAASLDTRDRARREREMLLEQQVKDAQEVAEQQKARAAAERHRVKQVSIAAVVAGTLFAVALVAFFWAQRALSNEARARMQEQKAREAAIERFDDANEAISIALQISEATEKYRSNTEALNDYEELRDLLDGLDKAQPNDSDVLAALGNVYDAIGNILVEEKKYELAIANYDEALPVRRKIASERSEFKRKYANVYMNRAQAEYALALDKLEIDPKQAAVHFANARPGFVEAQRVLEEIRTEGEVDPEWKDIPLGGMIRVIRDLAEGYYALGNLDYVEKKFEEALTNFEKVEPDTKQIYEVDSDPDTAEQLGNVITRLGETKKRLGVLRQKAGDGDAAKQLFESAESHYQDAREILEVVAAKNPDVDGYQRNLGLLYGAQASLHYEKAALGYESEGFLAAHEHRREQARIFQTLTGGHSDDAQFRNDRGQALIGLLYASYGASRNGSEVKPSFDTAEKGTLGYLDDLAERFTDEPFVKTLYYALSRFYSDMILFEEDEGDNERAQRLRDKHAALFKSLTARHPGDRFYQQLPNLPRIKIDSVKPD